MHNVSPNGKSARLSDKDMAALTETMDDKGKLSFKLSFALGISKSGVKVMHVDGYAGDSSIIKNAMPISWDILIVMTLGNMSMRWYGGITPAMVMANGPILVVALTSVVHVFELTKAMDDLGKFTDNTISCAGESKNSKAMTSFDVVL